MWTPTVPPDQWQLELDQVVTEFYVNANFAIGPFVWQIEVDQGITEFNVEANIAIRSID